MLDDIRDKLIRSFDGKVLFVFAVGHFRFVDHYTGFMVVTELIQGETGSR
jgi:hypothetical protein